jgi:CheY-like chemotaxis protein
MNDRINNNGHHTKKIEQNRLIAQIARKAFEAEYECLFLIDPSSGLARKLWQADPEASFFPPFFHYEEKISEYFTRYCYEQNPQEIIRQTSITTMQSMLLLLNTYSLSFYVTGENHRLLHKKAICFYTDDSKDMISLLIKDTTQYFADERDRYIDLQKALQETQAIAKTNTRFLKLLNRDMRTPIHSILGLTEIADNEISNPDVIRDYLYKIKSAGSSMSEIIDDILLLSRISQSKPSPKQEMVSLKKQLALLKSAYKEKLDVRGLTLLFDIQDDISEEIVTDVYFLNIVLHKLLDFVINYTVRGGEIHLSVNELLQKQNRTLMEFSVTSMGIDINPQQIEKLFLPNEFLMNELNHDLSSVDLNTIILKHYVAALGGTIVAQVGAGTSTKITISMNFSLPDAKERFIQTKDSFSAPDFHSYLAMIVDDDPINLEVGVKLLSRTGIKIIANSNGPDALLAVQEIEDKIDVIFVDIRMPGMDGLELSRRIRALPDPFIRKVPIIAMTVNDSEEDMKKSLDARINAHLIKPIEPSELYSVLGKYLQKKTD